VIFANLLQRISPFMALSVDFGGRSDVRYRGQKEICRFIAPIDRN